MKYPCKIILQLTLETQIGILEIVIGDKKTQNTALFESRSQIQTWHDKILYETGICECTNQ